MSDALARDVSLNVGLVCSIDNYPAYCSSNGYGPESVSPQGVYIKAGQIYLHIDLNIKQFVPNANLNFAEYQCIH